MSGDVQPRKRKDKEKKKRKDDDGYTPLNDDVNIHVYKEGGTGGNICAKIVFFFLFSALIVLIGLIIKENQGLTELEEVELESRYSQIFEGWVDKNVDEHDDDHSPELSHEDDDHDHEEEDEDHYESEEDQVDETEEEEQSEEAENEEEDEYEESSPRSEEETNEETDEEEQVLESEEDNTIEEDLSEEVDEPSDSQEKSKEETEEVDDVNISETDKDDDDDGDDEIKEEYKSKEQSKKEEDSDEDKDADRGEEDKQKPASKESKQDVKEESKEVESEKEALEETVAEKEQEQTGTEESAPQSSGDVNVGEGPESEPEQDDYEYGNITNEEDSKIKEEVDTAQEHLNKNVAYANKLFNILLEKYPLSPRTLYGKAKALDIMAEKEQSNELLQQALNYYMRALNAPNVPDALFVIAAERYINRARFMGQYKKAVAAHWQLIERFPDNPTYLNHLAVTYLTINLVAEARSILKRVLSKWPNDGFALVHYGFILKTTDDNLEESVEYMTKGLRTKEPGVTDGRFYFHLGDALTRLNRKEQAMQFYEEGVQEKVFMSKYQRSLYNVPRLTAKPWWKPEDFPSYQKLFLALKDNWHKIRAEGLSALNDQGYFQDEAENLRDTGTWKQLELFARGQKFTKNCAKSPVTCNIIQSFPDARGCRRGQTKFSVMHPGTHVWPHCGPTNCRLRIHLGLKIPPNTFIRVAEETRSWKEGDIIIFDDSFEHEVWHSGSDFRLVLIVDVWHPDLTPSEKKSLSSI